MKLLRLTRKTVTNVAIDYLLAIENENNTENGICLIATVLSPFFVIVYNPANRRRFEFHTVKAFETTFAGWLQTVIYETDEEN